MMYREHIMRLAVLVVATAGLATPSLAQNADVGQSGKTSGQTVPRQLPKPSSPADQFDLKTIDNGRDVQQRLEFNLPHSKDVFIFGDKTTSYPLRRDPGDISRPLLPEQDHYTFGIGKRF